jgi:uncharacterized SAM-binding protein YcdF (DUF218 family)
VLLGRYPRCGRALAWLGVLALSALTLPTVSNALLRSLDRTPALDFSQARQAQAIVIFGGGIRRAAPEYGGDTLGRLSLERVRYGAWVARKMGLPILVSGGAVHGGTEEALVMKRALEEEFGVAVRWVENRSRDTHTNARLTAAILLPQGITRVVLVAHGFDMPRATAELAAAGLHVTPAPTLVTAASPVVDHPVEWLPSMSALQGSYYALYELLADLVRAARMAF